MILAGCARNDIRTEVFQVEQLRTEASALPLKKALQAVAGIQDARVSLSNRTLTVVFHGPTIQIKNIEYAIVKAGYDLPNWPADPADKANLEKVIGR